MDAQSADLRGLTSAQVRERIAAGQVNAVRRRTSRSTADIVRANVFTWFNLVLGALWALMITFGSWRDALFGLVLVLNSAIGIVQEIRAKRTLDRLSLISAPRARVIRDAREYEVALDEIVLGDLVVLVPGGQIVVDGTLLRSEGLEVDESSLTGESVPVHKRQGESVMSGSFVVAGRGLCRATAVGADAYATRIEGSARRYSRVRSDVVDGINAVLKTIGYLLVPVVVLTVVANVAAAGSMAVRVTNTVAPLVAMVPEGLVLLSSIAFAASAVFLARHHALVNELPAVEGLARADVLCADKTGTLTEAEPAFGRFEPLGDGGGTADAVAAASTAVGRAASGAAAQAAALEALAQMAASDPAPNATARAIAQAVHPTAHWERVADVPFSSERKWSGIQFAAHGTWVLGAPDVVLEAERDAAPARTRLTELLGEGVRVLVLARTAEPLAATPDLPASLECVGFVLLVERIRPDAADTVRFLSEQGVALKVISGDHTATASSVAAQAGVPGAGRAVDARTLGPGADLVAAMESNVVFGRVMPEQKSDMVAALQRAGHAVAMTGDGVNDVLAVKQADLGIAMGTAVPATRSVSQIVLLDNRFSTLPLLMAEGRRVVANAERVANLFLTKSVWAAILAVAVALLGTPYPLLPRQITLAGSLTIGIPAFFFALGPSTRAYRRGFLNRVARFAVPAGAVIAIALLGTFLTARSYSFTLDEARTLCTLVLAAAGLGVICLLEWPLAGWRLGATVLVALGMSATFALPIAREFFSLTPLTAAEVALCLGLAVAATATVALLTASVRGIVRETA